jgi:hypothetical protein
LYICNNNGKVAKQQPCHAGHTIVLHNNSVGYHLGNQAIINGWSEQELLNQVINAANNGKLQIGP